MIGIAATIALGAISVYWLRASWNPEAGLQDIAQFTFVDGNVELLRPAEGSQLAPAETDGPIQTGDTLRTTENGRAALRMQDDLSLRVNVDSELVFASPDEIELLAGTVYVDTGGNGSNDMLQIQTVIGDIEHIGTQYEVQLSESALRVRVREGSIAYTGTSNTVTGSAGEQLDFDTGGLASRSQIAANAPEWQWIAELATLPAADEYLAGEVLSWIARELGLELDYSDPAFEQDLVTDTIIGLEGFNPTEALSAIERTSGITAQVSGNRLLVGN